MYMPRKSCFEPLCLRLCETCWRLRGTQQAADGDAARETCGDLEAKSAGSQGVFVSPSFVHMAP